MRGKVARDKMLRVCVRLNGGGVRSKDKSFEKWFAFRVGVARLCVGYRPCGYFTIKCECSLNVGIRTYVLAHIFGVLR